jgi:hypothetical protein
MVGDEEQYASAFALMARSLGYPSRVVMGFAPDVDDDDETVTVTGHDVTAWVEVAFEGAGWIAFSPTPDQTDVPQDQDPKPQTEPQPQVRQPPRSAAEQDDLVTAVEVDDGDSDDPAGLDIPAWLVALGLAVLIPGVLVFGPLLVVARLKAARAQRRRRAAEPHESVRGAWDELVDRYSELGLAVPVRATRLRTARELAGQVGVVGLVPAAERVDAAVFGDAPVGDTMVAVAWNETDDLVRAAYDGVPPRARLLSRYRLSSVRAWLNAASARVELARSRQASRVR